jgi:hypothetical protein
MGVTPSLINLGLKCNPFARGALAEVYESDPCELVVVGRRHRTAVNDIKQKIVAGPSWFFVIEGAWGMGKTTITRRVLCDVSQELGRNGFASIVISVGSLPRPDLGVLVLETVRRLYCIAREVGHPELVNILEQHLSKRVYPILGTYIEEIKTKAKTVCTSGLQLTTTIDNLTVSWAERCEYADRLLSEAADFVTYIAAELRKPIYIVYDQFDFIFTRSDQAKSCVSVPNFLLYFVKELLHRTSSGAISSRSRVVITASIQSDAWVPFIASIEELGDLQGVLGNYTLYNLNPLSEDEVKELLEAYLSRCRVKGEGIYPFHDDAIPIIYDLSEGVPRRIINYTNRLLVEAALKGYKPLIKSSHIAQLSLFLNEEFQKFRDVLTPCGSDPDKILRQYKLNDEPRRIVDSFVKLYPEVKSEGAQSCVPKILHRPEAVKLTCKDLILVFTGLKGTVREDMIRNIANKAIEGEPITEVSKKRIHIIIFTPGRLSRPSERLRFELKSKGINIHNKNIRDDPLAKTIAACLAYYAENPQLAKRRLTEDKLIEMIKTIFEIE